MSVCECIGTCVGGVLLLVGATVFYTCKFTGYLIFYICKYTYVGTCWCVKKIYNLSTAKNDNDVVQETRSTRSDLSDNDRVNIPDRRVYAPVNTNEFAIRSYLNNENAATVSNRIVKSQASTSNGLDRVCVHENRNISTNKNKSDATTNRYKEINTNASNSLGRVRDHVNSYCANNASGSAITTSNQVVSSKCASNSNKLREVIVPENCDSDSDQIGNSKINDSKVPSRINNNVDSATAKDINRNLVIPSIHNNQTSKNHSDRCKGIHRGNNCLANELYSSRNGQSGSNSSDRRKSRSRSRGRKNGQNEHETPITNVTMTNLTDVTLPTGRTVSISIPSSLQCHCRQMSETQLIRLWPGSGTDSQEYEIVSDEMNNTTNRNNCHVFSGYKIVSLHKVKNCCLWMKFHNRQKDIGKENRGVVNQRMLFHGSKAVDDIVHNGFDERHSNPNGMFGAGVYFAEHSSKSNHNVYGIRGGTGCEAHNDRNCYVCERKMLLCRVTLGKTAYKTTADRTAHGPLGYHSVTGVPCSTGLRYPEFVIYRGEQAYPEYLITYKIVKFKTRKKNALIVN